MSDSVERVGERVDGRVDGRIVGRIDERLERAGLRAGDPILGLAPGPTRASARAWPRRRYVELSRELRRIFPHARQAILVDPDDLWTGVRLHEETGKIHPLLGADLAPEELGELLHRLDLLVGGDHPILRRAARAGHRVVGLFGPTLPPPEAPRTRALRHDRWCSPCGFARCPLLHRGCQRAITIDEVVAACRDALS